MSWVLGRAFMAKTLPTGYFQLANDVSRFLFLPFQHESRTRFLRIAYHTLLWQKHASKSLIQKPALTNGTISSLQSTPSPENGAYRQASPALILFSITGFVPPLFSAVFIWLCVSFQTEAAGFSDPEWLLTALVVSVTMGLSILPSSLPLLAGAYFRGPEILFFYLPAYAAAAYLGFATARYFKADEIQKLLYAKPKALALFKRLQSKSFGLVLSTRLSPVMPFAFMNVLCASAGLKTAPYLGATLLGMLPRALLLTWAGTHAADLYTALMEGNLPFEWLLALVVVSFGAGTFIIYRALKRSPDSKANTTG